MNTTTKKILTGTAFAVFFGVVAISKTFAVSDSSISVDVSPTSPAPYENTTITLSSFAANLDTINITWFVNGKNSLSGIGKKSFSISVGAAGTEVGVQAKIFLPDGEIDKTIVLRPAVMVLLWQADDSYVPPFYRGKAMPTDGSEIKIVAIPEIKSGNVMVNPNNMTYSWKKDYNNDQSASGYGKNFYTYTNDYLENVSNIDVIASTIDQQNSSEGSITVGTVKPEILFYKKDDTFGPLWEEALSDGHTITGKEIILAEPFFISPSNIRRPELTFNWSIDDRSVSVPSYSKNLMPLQVQNGSKGESKLNLEIQNTEKIYATAEKTINIKF